MQESPANSHSDNSPLSSWTPEQWLTVPGTLEQLLDVRRSNMLLNTPASVPSVSVQSLRADWQVSWLWLSGGCIAPDARVKPVTAQLQVVRCVGAASSSLVQKTNEKLNRSWCWKGLQLQWAAGSWSHNLVSVSWIHSTYYGEAVGCIFAWPIWQSFWRSLMQLCSHVHPHNARLALACAESHSMHTRLPGPDLIPDLEGCAS